MWSCFWGPLYEQITQQVGQDCGFSSEQTAQMIELMRIFYKGYTFQPNDKGLLYNPTLTLYFLDKVQIDHKPPPKLLDANLAMDKNKLEYIASRPGSEKMIQKLLEDNPQLAVRELCPRFSRNDLTQATTEHLAALFFYFGLATTDGRTESGTLRLRIPNLVVRNLHFERLRELLLPDQVDLQSSLAPLTR